MTGGGGMGGITQAIADLLAAMGITLPAWGMPAVVLGIAVLLLPLILKNMRTSQARKLLVRSRLEGRARREALEQQALSLVSDNPVGMLALADLCVSQGRYGLARDILARLPDAGDTQLRRERRKLEEAMAPREPLTPEEAAVAIERFIEQGQLEEARVRLGRARQRWPEDAGLRALDDRARAGAASGG